MMKNGLRTMIRPVALTLVAPVIGFLLIYILELTCGLDIPKLYGSILNLITGVMLTFWIFPHLLGIPYGKINTKDFLFRLGIYSPKGYWKHLFLGIVLASLTLIGMLTASVLSGKYVFDPGKIDLSHIIFSLNPGIWEEIFYRGILMVLLIKFSKSMKKAFIFQILLFGIMHIKGFDFWSLFDILSLMVIAFGFTYAAYKTRLLTAGIVFHFLHDAFLFSVQNPSGTSENMLDKGIFYLLLWLMVGAGCLITKLSAERFAVQASMSLYIPYES